MPTKKDKAEEEKPDGKRIDDEKVKESAEDRLKREKEYADHPEKW